MPRRSNKVVLWLTETSVPRWQIALGFILATFITVQTTLRVETASIYKQDAIAKISAFRDSGSELDQAARDLTFAIFDKRATDEARSTFDHALIKHLKDVDALADIVTDRSLWQKYRAAVVYAGRASREYKDVASGKDFLIAMGVVRDRQDVIISSVRH